MKNVPYETWLHQGPLGDKTGVKMGRLKLFFKIQLLTQTTSKGIWRNWRFTIVISQRNREKYNLIDASYVGALFGGCLKMAYTHIILFQLAPAIIREFRRRATNWVELKTTGEAHNYSNISLSIRGGKAVSLSNISDTPIKTAMLRYNKRTIIEAMSALLFARQTQVVQAESYGSDAPWVEDLWNFANGDLSISLFDVTFEPRVLNGPQVGCRNCFSAVAGILTKSGHKKVKVLYNPDGYDVALRAGLNCFIDCIGWHLRKLDDDTEPVKVRDDMHMSDDESDKENIPPSRADEFFNSLEKDTQDGGSQMYQATLPFSVIEGFALRAKITIIATQMNKCESTQYLPNHNWITETVVYNGPTNKYTTPPLFLMIYPNSSNGQYFHAAVVSSVEATGSIKCKLCSGWYSAKAKHFENCVICKDCDRPHQKGGKHYLSCKANKKLAVSAIAQRTLQMKEEKVEEKQLYQHVHFADFECFTDKYGRHIPYLIVLKDITKKTPQVFWGENCLKEFVDALFEKSMVGYLFFHNGSGYDFNLVITGLLQYNKIAKKKNKDVGITILRRGTKVLAAEIKTRPTSLHLRDFCLFIQAALKKLCIDFKVPDYISKLDFDHTLIKSFADAELYKVKCKAYCENDVLSLEYIYKSFGGALWKICPGVLVPANMSLASQALEMWKKMENKKILAQLTLPANLADYNLFRSMYHGGRVLATVAKYDSPLWKVIQDDEEPFFDPDTELSYKTVQQVLDNLSKRDKNKLLKMVDVVSLYPSVMHKFKYPIGQYKRKVITELEKKVKAWKIQNIVRSGKRSLHGVEVDGITGEVTQHWEDNEVYTKLKEKMFRCSYIVDVDAKPEFIVAFLMRKTEDAQTGQTKPEQSLAPLRDYPVTGVELFEAIKIGYDLLKVHEVIEWPKQEYIYKDYINPLVAEKMASSNDKSSARYISAKLLMNALSGRSSC